MINLTVARAAAMLNTLVNELNGGSIRIYAGAMPATADTALSGQTLLATVPISGIAYANTATAILAATAAEIGIDTAVDASGTATWARVVNSGGGTILDADVGLTGSGAMIEVNRVNLVQDGTFDITGFVFDFSAAV